MLKKKINTKMEINFVIWQVGYDTFWACCKNNFKFLSLKTRSAHENFHFKSFKEREDFHFARIMSLNQH